VFLSGQVHLGLPDLHPLGGQIPSCHKQPGFFFSLDILNAYDRVSLQWVDRAMAAMGFRAVFRGWMATLHREASAAFLLQGILSFIDILFSISQGNPLAALLFILYLEPFQVRHHTIIYSL
jgi:hypothetical protein